MVFLSLQNIISLFRLQFLIVTVIFSFKMKPNDEIIRKVDDIWSGICFEKLLFVESVLAMEYIVELDGCYSAPQNLVGLAIFGVLWAQGPEEGIQIWRGLLERPLSFRYCFYHGQNLKGANDPPSSVPPALASIQ